MTVDSITCTIKLAPVGGSRRSLARVTVCHEPSATDDAIVPEALQVALDATNRLVHALSFVGGGRTARPLLELRDLKDLQVANAGSPLDVNPTLVREMHLPLKEPPSDLKDEVQAVLDVSSGPLSEAVVLWQNALEAFYEDRLREAAIAARAALEVGLRAALAEAASVYQASAPDDATREMIDDFLKRSESSPVPTQLDHHCGVLLGFSFVKHWDQTSWERLNTFFDVRHRVAHGSTQPTPDNVFKGISLVRQVLKTIEEKLAALPRGP